MLLNLSFPRILNLMTVASTLLFCIAGLGDAKAARSHAPGQAGALSQAVETFERAVQGMRGGGTARQLAGVLCDATDGLVTAMGQEAGRRRITRKFASVDDAFRALRQVVHSKRFVRRSDAGILDDWYAVAFEVETVRRRIARRPPSPRPPRQAAWQFTGRLANVDVVFEGVDREAVFAQCESFVSRGRSVSSLTAFGTTSRRSWGRWSPAQQCAIVALNARPQRENQQRVTVAGKVESLAFDLRAKSLAAYRRAARRFVPLAVGSDSVSTMTLAGRQTRRSWGKWSAAAVAEIVAYAPDAGRGNVVARGVIAKAPFVFRADSRAGVSEQCRAFVDTVVDRNINAISVGGTTRRKRWGKWSASEACMTVASLADSEDRYSGR